MPDFPKTPIVYPPLASVTTTSAANSPTGYMQAAAGGTFAASTAWGTANLGVYIPVYISAPIKIQKMSVLNGATAAGNTDVGIYDEDMARLVSIGPTAQSGTSVVQTFDVTDTFLNPGAYFLALASTDATATFIAGAFVNTARGRVCCCLQETGLSSGTLPATATPAAFAQTFIPIIIAHARSTV
jgi:hypothetical protein